MTTMACTHVIRHWQTDQERADLSDQLDAARIEGRIGAVIVLLAQLTQPCDQRTAPPPALVCPLCGSEQVTRLGVNQYSVESARCEDCGARMDARAADPFDSLHRQIKALNETAQP